MPYDREQGIWSGGQSADPMVRALRGGAMNRIPDRKPLPGMDGGMGPRPTGRRNELNLPQRGVPGNTGPLPPNMPPRMGGNAPPMPVSMPPTGGVMPPAPATQPIPRDMATGGNMPPMPVSQPATAGLAAPPMGGVMPPKGGIMEGGPISAPVPLGGGMPYGTPNPGSPFGGMPPRYGGPGNYRPPIDFGRTPPGTPSQGPVGQGPTGIPGGINRLMFRR